MISAALGETKCFFADPVTAAIIRTTAVAASEVRRRKFSESLNTVITTLLHLAPASAQKLPPYLSNTELPSISIVTLTYNRRVFLDLCFLNLISTDYPKDKIEWVVVDDSDEAEKQGADKIMKFGRQCAPMSLTYLPLAKKTSIGAKRNLGCLRAAHGIVLMMDDDDHYPPSSFRRRVAWLTHSWRPQAVTATTIATYSLTSGVSAVNTPPLTLPLRQRISEATLTFSKTFWEQRGFPELSLAEGEGFLEGREGDVLEIPANQIIVAMSHGKSASQRRVPEGKPGCFWGFDPEFLTFLHGLAGVTVESEAAPPTTEMD
jgi:glycosyltransferase involved in cell wall biosynthesis